MQCPHCGFQNMPGVDRCGRCEAVLALQQPIVRLDFQPPRAGRFGFLRPLGYWLNRKLDRFLPSSAFGGLAALRNLSTAARDIVPRDSVMPMALSTVPGLGHVVQGRPGRGVLAGVMWCACAAVAANFYVGMAGTLFLMLLMALHVAIVLDAGRIPEFAPTRRGRLRAGFLVLFIVAVGYGLGDYVVHRFVDLTVIPFSVPVLNVRSGDTLVLRKKNLRIADLRIGQLIAVASRPDNRARIGPNQYFSFMFRGLMVARVFGMPGDEIELSPDGMTVNGTPVARTEFPGTPILFPRIPVKLTVPSDSVLAVCPLDRIVVDADLAAWQHDPVFVEEVWKRVYFVNEQQLRGRFVGTYLPLARRGAL